MRTTLKDKENQIRNMLEEEKQKIEKKTSGCLSKKRETFGEFQKTYTTNVVSSTPKMTVHTYSRDKKY
jgi:hypothetical protein